VSEIRTFALGRPSWRVWVALALAVVVVVVLFIARVTGGGDADEPLAGGVRTSASGSPGDGVTEPAEPSGSPLVDGPDGPEASAEPSVAAPAAVTVALAFAQAFVTRPPASAPDQWLAGVSRHTDQALTEQLRGMNPAELPASRLTGAAASVQGGVTSAEVRIPTDAGPLLAVCVLVAGRWVVADYELEEAPS
jgi:hypothetical protein